MIPANYLKTGFILFALALGAASAPGAGEPAAPAWPDGPPARIAEDVFGVRFRQMQEMDGDRAALAFLLKEFERSPRPHVKAYVAWICLFSEGWGHPQMKDLERGRKLAEEAVHEGSIVARDVLARAMGRGLFGQPDRAEVMRLLTEAAEGGATWSLARLGYYRAIGFDGRADLDEGTRIARRAAELGQPYGLIEIGEAFEKGALSGGMAMDYYSEASAHASGEAWKKLEKLEGQKQAMGAYFRSLGYVREANRAAWIAPARVKEHIKRLEEMAGDMPDAMVELGRVYSDGVFAKADYARARAHFETAARQDSREAAFFLARMRLRGWGGKAEPAAIEEIRRFADEGVVDAAHYLGWLYYWGVKEAPGIVKDPARAFAYVRRAAEKGHPRAVVDLAFCYEHGIGTPVNYALAAKVYWQAWQRGYPEGRNRTRRLMAFVKNDLQ